MDSGKPVDALQKGKPLVYKRSGSAVRLAQVHVFKRGDYGCWEESGVWISIQGKALIVDGIMPPSIPDFTLNGQLITGKWGELHYKKWANITPALRVPQAWVDAMLANPLVWSEVGGTPQAFLKHFSEVMAPQALASLQLQVQSIPSFCHEPTYRANLHTARQHAASAPSPAHPHHLKAPRFLRFASSAPPSWEAPPESVDEASDEATDEEIEPAPVHGGHEAKYEARGEEQARKNEGAKDESGSRKRRRVEDEDGEEDDDEVDEDEGSEEEEKEDSTCAVCLESLWFSWEEKGQINTVLSGCGHSFHARCIDTWFQQQTSEGSENSCPYCRNVDVQGERYDVRVCLAMTQRHREKLKQKHRENRQELRQEHREKRQQLKKTVGELKKRVEYLEVELLVAASEQRNEKKCKMVQEEEHEDQREEERQIARAQLLSSLGTLESEAQCMRTQLELLREQLVQAGLNPLV